MTCFPCAVIPTPGAGCREGEEWFAHGQDARAHQRAGEGARHLPEQNTRQLPRVSADENQGKCFANAAGVMLMHKQMGAEESLQNFGQLPDL